jgi:hypothetical protein
VLANCESIFEGSHSEEKFARLWGLVILSFFLCVFCSIQYLAVHIALAGRMIGDWWIGRDLEGSSCGLI